MLEEAAKLCENVLLPLNRAGDEEGCVYENGVVRTPEGFKEAYDTFVAGGWTGLAGDPEYGGQGLPKTVQVRGRRDDLLGQPLVRHLSRALGAAPTTRSRCTRPTS